VSASNAALILRKLTLELIDVWMIPNLAKEEAIQKSLADSDFFF